MSKCRAVECRRKVKAGNGIKKLGKCQNVALENGTKIGAKKIRGELKMPVPRRIVLIKSELKIYFFVQRMLVLVFHHKSSALCPISNAARNFVLSSFTESFKPEAISLSSSLLAIS